MRYGHKSTSYSGIYQWLQGHRNKRQSWDEINRLDIIPKELDINQKEKWVKNLIIEFLNSVDKPVTKKTFSFNKHPYLVQVRFEKFTKYVYAKYLPKTNAITGEELTLKEEML